VFNARRNAHRRLSVRNVPHDGAACTYHAIGTHRNPRDHRGADAEKAPCPYFDATGERATWTNMGRPLDDAIMVNGRVCIDDGEVPDPSVGVDRGTREKCDSSAEFG
jgi:hypothetical protein